MNPSRYSPLKRALHDFPCEFPPLFFKCHENKYIVAIFQVNSTSWLQVEYVGAWVCVCVTVTPYNTQNPSAHTHTIVHLSAVRDAAPIGQDYHCKYFKPKCWRKWKIRINIFRGKINYPISLAYKDLHNLVHVNKYRNKLKYFSRHRQCTILICFNLPISELMSIMECDCNILFPPM